MLDEKMWLKVFEAFGDTAYMVFWALLVSVVLGGALGLLLYLTASRQFFKNQVINEVGNVLVNVVRSVPYVILMVVVLPLAKILVGTTLGRVASVVPLAISSTAFFARLAENAFSDVDKGVIEAAVATGAKPIAIVLEILFPEALPQLIRQVTVTTISLIGFSAMAGTIGGGGVGDLAIRYGYQRFQTEVMVVCVIILIVVVQGLQMTGDFIARKIDKR